MIPSKSSSRVVIDNSHIDIDNNSDDSEVEINYQSKKSSSFHVKSPVKTHQSLKSSPQIRNRSSSSSASTSSSDEERPSPGTRPFYLLKCVFCSTLRFLQLVSINVGIKLGRITRPRLAIRQKLAASENIRV